MSLKIHDTPTLPVARRLLRPMQVHRDWGIPKARLYEALTSGELPASDISRPPRPGQERKPVWLIDPADLEAWLKGLQLQGHG